jgi:hypothetical protein
MKYLGGFQEKQELTDSHLLHLRLDFIKGRGMTVILLLAAVMLVQTSQSLF